MSRLMRIAYGHGGTRLERILVAASPGPAPAPRWLKLLVLAVWLCVPVLVCRFAVPKAPRQTTVIDTSRLELMPPILPEPPHVKPVEPLLQPPPEPPQSGQKPLERPPEEMPPPTITRPAAPRTPDVTEYQPRIARQRAQVADAGTSAAPRVRRNAATATEASLEPTTITRTRGAAAADAPAATGRVTPLRRARVSEGVPTGTGPELHFARRERSAGSTGESAPRVVAARSRETGTGAVESAKGSSLALSRGVSLASLDICASPGEEEEKITAVLGAVGSQQSCRDGSGEYRFKGTQRISSFNLMIYPAKGRRPSNRCEELENAYRCLKGR